MDSRPQLDELYYLGNFELLCDTVQEQYQDLLLEPELSFLRRFRRLSETSESRENSVTQTTTELLQE